MNPSRTAEAAEEVLLAWEYNNPPRSASVAIEQASRTCCEPITGKLVNDVRPSRPGHRRGLRGLLLAEAVRVEPTSGITVNVQEEERAQDPLKVHAQPPRQALDRKPRQVGAHGASLLQACAPELHKQRIRLRVNDADRNDAVLAAPSLRQINTAVNV